MSLRVLVVGNINWFNLRAKHIQPLLEAGLKVTVLSDTYPLEEEYTNGIDFIHLNKPKHSLLSLICLIKILVLSLLNGTIFKKKDRMRVKFLYNNAFKYIRQIGQIDYSKYDVVHCHFLTRPVCVAAIFSRIPLPLVATIHGSDLYVSATNTFIDRYVINQFFDRSKEVYVPGNAEKDYAVGIGAMDERIKIMPWNVDTRQFFPPEDEASRKQLMHKWLGNDHQKVVLSVRNLNPIYNIETVLKAFDSALDNTNDSVVLLLAGAGSEEVSLKQLSQQLKHSKNIRFLGRVKPNELRELYQLSDIYIQNPLSDALPYSLLEAIACGVPIVCGEIGSISDVKDVILGCQVNNFFFSEPGVLSHESLTKYIIESLNMSKKCFNGDFNLFETPYNEVAGLSRIVESYQRVI